MKNICNIFVLKILIFSSFLNAAEKSVVLDDPKKGGDQPVFSVLSELRDEAPLSFDLSQKEDSESMVFQQNECKKPIDDSLTPVKNPFENSSIPLPIQQMFSWGQFSFDPRSDTDYPCKTLNKTPLSFVTLNEMQLIKELEALSLKPLDSESDEDQFLDSLVVTKDSMKERAEVEKQLPTARALCFSGLGLKEKFLDKMLSKTEALEELVLRDLEPLKKMGFLYRIPEISSLMVLNCFKIKDLSGLLSLQALTRLTLQNFPIEDKELKEVLEKNVNIVFLDLAETKVTVKGFKKIIPHIKNVTKLLCDKTHLLSMNSEIIDLFGIHLKSLKVLGISAEGFSVEMLKKVEMIESLKELQLFHCGDNFSNTRKLPETRLIITQMY